MTKKQLEEENQKLKQEILSLKKELEELKKKEVVAPISKEEYLDTWFL